MFTTQSTSASIQQDEPKFMNKDNIKKIKSIWSLFLNRQHYVFFGFAIFYAFITFVFNNTCLEGRECLLPGSFLLSIAHLIDQHPSTYTALKNVMLYLSIFEVIIALVMVFKHVKQKSTYIP